MSGIATFPNEGDAIGVLAQVANHTALMRRPRVTAPAPMQVELPSSEGQFLNEAQSLELALEIQNIVED